MLKGLFVFARNVILNDWVPPCRLVEIDCGLHSSVKSRCQRVFCALGVFDACVGVGYFLWLHIASSFFVKVDSISGSPSPSYICV